MARKQKKSFTKPQIIVLIIIGLSMLAVIVATICAFLFRPENLVKNEISEISADYYENYLYEKFNSYDYSPEELASFLQKYQETGITTTSLRQLLLYDHQKHADSAPLLKKYCNENKTYVKYFPEPPFSKTSYRADITYSCEF